MSLGTDYSFRGKPFCICIIDTFMFRKFLEQIKKSLVPLFIFTAFIVKFGLTVESFTPNLVVWIPGGYSPKFIADIVRLYRVGKQIGNNRVVHQPKIGAFVNGKHNIGRPASAGLKLAICLAISISCSW
jgi:hypothetical protein